MPDSKPAPERSLSGSPAHRRHEPQRPMQLTRRPALRQDARQRQFQRRLGESRSVDRGPGVTRFSWNDRHHASNVETELAAKGTAHSTHRSPEQRQLTRTGPDALGCFGGAQPDQATGEAVHGSMHEPRPGGRGEVDLDPRVRRQPGLDLRVFVGGVVVHDQMQVGPVAAVGVGAGDMVEEDQELLVPVPRLADPGDLRRWRSPSAANKVVVPCRT